MPRPFGGPSPPIPTYDEAVGAEREGLLGTRPVGRHPAGYQPPSDHSRRDSDVTEPELDDEDDRELRHDIEQMELEEPDSSSTRRSRLFSRLPKFTEFREHLSGVSLPPIPEYMRPSWILLIRFLALMLVLGIVYGLVVMRVLTWQHGPLGIQFLPESVRMHIQWSVSTENIKTYLKEITFDDHIAGTKGDFFLAEYVENLYKEAGLDGIFRDDYQVYLNYPRMDGRRVAIIEPEALRFEAILEEAIEKQDPPRHPTLAFHGHSKSGNITGPLVYANYGAREDFEYLKSQNVNLTGSIVLVKYYGTQGDRALKVKAAELAGAAGCLIYSDPADDGFLKGPVAPDGPWRRADSLQRGAVSLMSWVVGDVLTPGWASTSGADRLPVDNNPGLVNIPSLPLAWRDAAPLLAALKGHGKQVPQNWLGGVPDISEWWTGDAGSSPIVHLMNLQDEVQKQPIRNIIGKIEGYEQPEKVIYLGNHRDAWCFGAVDPGTGTAVLLEVVRIFGTLLERGWRPRRSIVFASWDGEEYNLIGSTEHVEEGIAPLRKDGVAYLNIDTGVAGHNLRAAGNPLLEELLLTVLNRVTLPYTNESAADNWHNTGKKLEGLGAGSDYVAFQDLAGTASFDIGFEGEDAGFPYHSCQETLDYFERFVDPDYLYVATLAEIMSLMVYELADAPMLSFDFNAYAREVSGYVTQLKDDAAALISSGLIPAGQPDIDLTSLETAAKSFVDSAYEFMDWQKDWTRRLLGVDEYNPLLESRLTAIERITRNVRMSNFDTHLLDLAPSSKGREGGVPGRTQFKHVVYGPQLWSGYDEAYFPHIRDALFEYKNISQAQEMVEVVAERLEYASHKLNH